MMKKKYILNKGLPEEIQYVILKMRDNLKSLKEFIRKQMDGHVIQVLQVWSVSCLF